MGASAILGPSSRYRTSIQNAPRLYGFPITPTGDQRRIDPVRSWSSVTTARFQRAERGFDSPGAAYTGVS